MLVLRCTAKLLTFLGDPAQPREEAPAAGGAHAEWYATLVASGRRKHVVAMHIPTLYAVVLPNCTVRMRGRFEAELLGAVRSAMDADGFASLVTHPGLVQQPVVFQRTVERRYIGSLGDLASMVTGIEDEGATWKQARSIMNNAAMKVLGMRTANAEMAALSKSIW